MVPTSADCLNNNTCDWHQVAGACCCGQRMVQTGHRMIQVTLSIQRLGELSAARRFGHSHARGGLRKPRRTHSGPRVPAGSEVKRFAVKVSAGAAFPADALPERGDCAPATSALTLFVKPVRPDRAGPEAGGLTSTFRDDATEVWNAINDRKRVYFMVSLGLVVHSRSRQNSKNWRKSSISLIQVQFVLSRHNRYRSITSTSTWSM